jgi:cyclin-dependent kinase
MIRCHVSFEHPTGYKPVAVLGQGTVTIVCKAERSRPNAPADEPREMVAIKKIPNVYGVKGEDDISHTVQVLRRVCREFETMLLFNECQQTVHLEDAYWSKDGQDLYLVMEYVPLPVYKLMRDNNRALVGDHWRYITAQILLGLHAMHSLSILHGDFGPGNILIDPETLRCKVADFGLCKAHLRRRYDALDIVPLPYQSPEVLAECQEQGETIDIWSAGCIAMEVIIQEPFLHAKDAKATLAAIVTRVTGPPTDGDLESIKNLGGREAVLSFLRRYQDLGPACDTPQWKARARDQGLSEAGVEVFSSIFTFDPLKRPTAKQLLGMLWFSENADCKELVQESFELIEEWTHQDMELRLKTLRDLDGMTTVQELRTYLVSRIHKFADQAVDL